MKIEAALSKVLVEAEELSLQMGYGFMQGYYLSQGLKIKGVNPLMVGAAYAVNEVMKYTLNKVLQNLAAYKLKPSQIKYIGSAGNLLVDAAFIISRVRSGAILPLTGLISGGFALQSLRTNLYLAGLQRKTDYPFTAANFKEKK